MRLAARFRDAVARSLKTPLYTDPMVSVVAWLLRWACLVLVILFILSLWPFGLITLFPILALYVAGYRIVDGGSMNWTDDIEDFLASEENR